MDEMADRPVIPTVCPRCGKKVVVKGVETIECKECGELYYDPWLGIWRIKRYEEKP